MRPKIKLKGTITAALDIGSSKVACFIARIIDDEGHFEILGIGHHASDGIKSGKVVDLDSAESAIRKTVHAAENMAANAIKGYPLREVIVNVPGTLVKSHGVDVDINVSGQDVTDNDIRRALAKAQDHTMEEEWELIHTIPRGYSIDGHGSIREPRGMVGDHLSVNVHLVTAPPTGLRNMASCIERSHLDIMAFCSAPYAAGLASLVDDEKELGCTVIDMGGGVTSFAVFHEGHMVFNDAIPVGGLHVTKDIAHGLTTSIQDAERLKNLYGSALASSTDESELISVAQLGEDDQTQQQHVPRSLLVGIIQPRLEEILEQVRARLKDSGVAELAGRRVVLTGGASQIPGLRDLGQLVLDKQVRLGRPIRVSGLADAVSGPAFATTAGLLSYMAEHHDEMPSEVMALAEPGNIWERVQYWLRDNW